MMLHSFRILTNLADKTQLRDKISPYVSAITIRKNTIQFEAKTSQPGLFAMLMSEFLELPVSHSQHLDGIRSFKKRFLKGSDVYNAQKTLNGLDECTGDRDDGLKNLSNEKESEKTNYREHLRNNLQKDMSIYDVSKNPFKDISNTFISDFLIALGIPIARTNLPGSANKKPYHKYEGSFYQPSQSCSIEQNIMRGYISCSKIILGHVNRFDSFTPYKSIEGNGYILVTYTGLSIVFCGLQNLRIDIDKSLIEDFLFYNIHIDKNSNSLIDHTSFEFENTKIIRQVENLQASKNHEGLFLGSKDFSMFQKVYKSISNEDVLIPKLKFYLNLKNTPMLYKLASDSELKNPENVNTAKIFTILNHIEWERITIDDFDTPNFWFSDLEITLDLNNEYNHIFDDILRIPCKEACVRLIGGLFKTQKSVLKHHYSILNKIYQEFCKISKNNSNQEHGDIPQNSENSDIDSQSNYNPLSNFVSSLKDLEREIQDKMLYDDEKQKHITKDNQSHKEQLKTPFDFISNTSKPKTYMDSQSTKEQLCCPDLLHYKCDNSQKIIKNSDDCTCKNKLYCICPSNSKSVTSSCKCSNKLYCKCTDKAVHSKNDLNINRHVLEDKVEKKPCVCRNKLYCKCEQTKVCDECKELHCICINTSDTRNKSQSYNFRYDQCISSLNKIPKPTENSTVSSFSEKINDDKQDDMPNMGHLFQKNVQREPKQAMINHRKTPSIDLCYSQNLQSPTSTRLSKNQNNPRENKQMNTKNHNKEKNFSYMNQKKLQEENNDEIFEGYIFFKKVFFVFMMNQFSAAENIFAFLNLKKNCAYSKINHNKAIGMSIYQMREMALKSLEFKNFYMFEVLLSLKGRFLINKIKKSQFVHIINQDIEKWTQHLENNLTNRFLDVSDIISKCQSIIESENIIPNSTVPLETPLTESQNDDDALIYKNIKEKIFSNTLATSKSNRLSQTNDLLKDKKSSTSNVVSFQKHRNQVEAVYADNTNSNLYSRTKISNLGLDKGQNLLVRNVTLTPFQTIVSQPFVCLGNRVLRNFNKDFFIRVNFRDENQGNIKKAQNNSLVYERIRNRMKNGIQIGSRRFFFLATSASQLKQHSAWFVCPYLDFLDSYVDASRYLHGKYDFIRDPILSVLYKTFSEFQNKIHAFGGNVPDKIFGQKTDIDFEKQRRFTNKKNQKSISNGTGTSDISENCGNFETVNNNGEILEISKKSKVDGLSGSIQNELEKKTDLSNELNRVFTLSNSDKRDKVTGASYIQFSGTDSGTLREGDIYKDISDETDCIVSCKSAPYGFTGWMDLFAGTKYYEYTKEMELQSIVKFICSGSTLDFLKTDSFINKMLNNVPKKDVLIGSDFVREWMGSFSGIKNIGKYAIRLGQALSGTLATIYIDNIVHIPDIERNGYCFSDGVGRINHRTALNLVKYLNLPEMPSAYQIRIGGYKGVVSLYIDHDKMSKANDNKNVKKTSENISKFQTTVQKSPNALINIKSELQNTNKYHTGKSAPSTIDSPDNCVEKRKKTETKNAIDDLNNHNDGEPRIRNIDNQIYESVDSRGMSKIIYNEEFLDIDSNTKPYVFRSIESITTPIHELSQHKSEQKLFNIAECNRFQYDSQTNVSINSEKLLSKSAKEHIHTLSHTINNSKEASNHFKDDIAGFSDLIENKKNNSIPCEKDITPDHDFSNAQNIYARSESNSVMNNRPDKESSQSYKKLIFSDSAVDSQNSMNPLQVSCSVVPQSSNTPSVVEKLGEKSISKSLSDNDSFQNTTQSPHKISSVNIIDLNKPIVNEQRTTSVQEQINNFSNSLFLRGSMKKFESEHNQLEIVSFSQNTPCFLNRQIIFILTALGIPRPVIGKMHDEYVSKIYQNRNYFGKKHFQHFFNDDDIDNSSLLESLASFDEVHQKIKEQKRAMRELVYYNDDFILSNLSDISDRTNKNLSTMSDENRVFDPQKSCINTPKINSSAVLEIFNQNQDDLKNSVHTSRNPGSCGVNSKNHNQVNLHTVQTDQPISNQELNLFKKSTADGNVFEDSRADYSKQKAIKSSEVILKSQKSVNEILSSMGSFEKNDYFLSTLQEKTAAEMIRDVIAKSRIFVCKGRMLMGIVDEYDCLAEDEVFIRHSLCMNNCIETECFQDRVNRISVDLKNPAVLKQTFPSFYEHPVIDKHAIKFVEKANPLGNLKLENSHSECNSHNKYGFDSKESDHRQLHKNQSRTNSVKRNEDNTVKNRRGNKLNSDRVDIIHRDQGIIFLNEKKTLKNTDQADLLKTKPDFADFNMKRGHCDNDSRSGSTQRSNKFDKDDLGSMFELLDDINSQTGINETSSGTQKIHNLKINQNIHDENLKDCKKKESNTETKIAEGGSYKIKYDRLTDIVIGTVAIAKNPCLHPGDIRTAKAVYRSELCHLKDVIVFSSRGKRPLFNMCSGSDLDGDQYHAIWDERLIPKILHSPDEYASYNALEKDLVTMNDVLNFYIKYMRDDELGLIANSHLASCDSLGILSEQCLALASLFNRGVDFPKTGYVARIPTDLLPDIMPDFMGRNTGYKSKHIIGVLYRRAKILAAIKYCPCICKYKPSPSFLEFFSFNCNQDIDFNEKIKKLVREYQILRNEIFPELPKSQKCAINIINKRLKIMLDTNKSSYSSEFTDFENPQISTPTTKYSFTERNDTNFLPNEQCQQINDLNIVNIYEDYNSNSNCILNNVGELPEHQATSKTKSCTKKKKKLKTPTGAKKTRDEATYNLGFTNYVHRIAANIRYGFHFWNKISKRHRAFVNIPLDTNNSKNRYLKYIEGVEIKKSDSNDLKTFSSYFAKDSDKLNARHLDLHYPHDSNRVNNLNLSDNNSTSNTPKYNFANFSLTSYNSTGNSSKYSNSAQIKSNNIAYEEPQLTTNDNAFKNSQSMPYESEKSGREISDNESKPNIRTNKHKTEDKFDKLPILHNSTDRMSVSYDPITVLSSASLLNFRCEEFNEEIFVSKNKHSENKDVHNSHLQIHDSNLKQNKAKSSPNMNLNTRYLRIRDSIVEGKERIMINSSSLDESKQDKILDNQKLPRNSTIQRLKSVQTLLSFSDSQDTGFKRENCKRVAFIKCFKRTIIQNTEIYGKIKMLTGFQTPVSCMISPHEYQKEATSFFRKLNNNVFDKNPALSQPLNKKNKRTTSRRNYHHLGSSKNARFIRMGEGIRLIPNMEKSKSLGSAGNGTIDNIISEQIRQKQNILYKLDEIYTVEYLEKLLKHISVHDSSNFPIYDSFLHEVKVLLERHGLENFEDALLAFKDNTISTKLWHIIKKYRKQLSENTNKPEILYKALSCYKLGMLDCGNSIKLFGYIQSKVLKNNLYVVNVFKNILRNSSNICDVFQQSKNHIESCFLRNLQVSKIFKISSSEVFKILDRERMLFTNINLSNHYEYQDRPVDSKKNSQIVDITHSSKKATVEIECTLKSQRKNFNFDDLCPKQNESFRSSLELNYFPLIDAKSAPVENSVITNDSEHESCNILDDPSYDRRNPQNHSKSGQKIFNRGLDNIFRRIHDAFKTDSQLSTEFIYEKSRFSSIGLPEKPILETDIPASFCNDNLTAQNENEYKKSSNLLSKVENHQSRSKEEYLTAPIYESKQPKGKNELPQSSENKSFPFENQSELSFMNDKKSTQLLCEDDLLSLENINFTKFPQKFLPINEPCVSDKNMSDISTSETIVSYFKNLAALESFEKAFSTASKDIHLNICDALCLMNIPYSSFCYYPSVLFVEPAKKVSLETVFNKTLGNVLKLQNGVYLEFTSYHKYKNLQRYFIVTHKTSELFFALMLCNVFCMSEFSRILDFMFLMSCKMYYCPDKPEGDKIFTYNTAPCLSFYSSIQNIPDGGNYLLNICNILNLEISKDRTKINNTTVSISGDIKNQESTKIPSNDVGNSNKIEELENSPGDTHLYSNIYQPSIYKDDRNITYASLFNDRTLSSRCECDFLKNNKSNVSKKVFTSNHYNQTCCQDIKKPSTCNIEGNEKLCHKNIEKLKYKHQNSIIVQWLQFLSSICYEQMETVTLEKEIFNGSTVQTIKEQLNELLLDEKQCIKDIYQHNLFLKDTNFLIAKTKNTIDTENSYSKDHFIKQNLSHNSSSIKIANEHHMCQDVLDCTKIDTLIYDLPPISKPHIQNQRSKSNDSNVQSLNIEYRSQTHNTKEKTYKLGHNSFGSQSLDQKPSICLGTFIPDKKIRLADANDYMLEFKTQENQYYAKSRLLSPSYKEHSLNSSKLIIDTTNQENNFINGENSIADTKNQLNDLYKMKGKVLDNLIILKKKLKNISYKIAQYNFLRLYENIDLLGFIKWLGSDDSEKTGNLLYTIAAILSSNHTFSLKMMAIDDIHIQYHALTEIPDHYKGPRKIKFRKSPYDMIVVGMFDSKDTVYMHPIKSEDSTVDSYYVPILNNKGKCHIEHYKEEIRSFLLHNIGSHLNRKTTFRFSVQLYPGKLSFINLQSKYINNNFEIGQIIKKIQLMGSKIHISNSNRDVTCVFSNTHPLSDANAMERSIEAKKAVIAIRNEIYRLYIEILGNRYTIVYQKRSNSFLCVEIIKNPKVLSSMLIFDVEDSVVELTKSEIIYDLALSHWDFLDKFENGIKEIQLMTDFINESFKLESLPKNILVHHLEQVLDVHVQIFENPENGYPDSHMDNVLILSLRKNFSYISHLNQFVLKNTEKSSFYESSLNLEKMDYHIFDSFFKSFWNYSLRYRSGNFLN